MNKKKFLQAVDTLKRYRRAELLDEQGRELITKLYVDPLPDDHVLETLLKPNTTFLVGRKGTGKSTIFQRAQESLSLDVQATWAYIDIKTLYESSTSEIVGEFQTEIQNALSPEAVQRLSIFKSFILELILEIKNQISIRVNSSTWNRVRENFSGSASELFEKLEEFIDELKRDQYINITGQICTSQQDEEKVKESINDGEEISAKLDIKPSMGAKYIAQEFSELESKHSQNYSQIFIRVFNIKRLISRLRDILTTLKVKYLYIFIDDFSELPRNEMEQVVDTILAPLNNWSDEFIKLKIAVYPGRIYPGKIDLSKVDQVYLDIYRAYGRDDVANMEDRAIDFTKRLVVARLKHFCEESPDKYFEADSIELWRTLFHACLGNPRILGYILYFCYETSIIYGKAIGIKAIQSAARRYYDEKISYYFRLNKFLHEPFEERSSIYSLKELIEELVKRAKDLRSYRKSIVMKELSGRPPTSHFYISREYEPILSSLELNFFLTKYYEMKDRDGNDVSVYALNYGLCQQETINFGRPREKREHRLYFVERIFNFNSIILSYIRVNQEIICKKCGNKHEAEMLKAIEAFNMLCPTCKEGTCHLVNLSRKYEDLINSVSEESLLPGTELGILKTLHDEKKRMFAKEIAAELDCSYQLVGKRGRKLGEQGLVFREENQSGRRVFAITDTAEKVYFAEITGDTMNFEEESEKPKDEEDI